MARNFNGTTDRIDWGNVCPATAAMSVSAWARVTADGVRREVMTKEAATPKGWELCITAVSGFVEFGVFGNGAYPTSQSTSTGILIADGWSHLGGSRDANGGTLRTYVRGAADGTGSAGAAAPEDDTTVLRFGGRAADRPMWGDLAELAVWDAELNASEFAALGKGFSPLLIRPTSLVLYAPLIGRYSPEIDLVGSASGTLTGTANAAHTRVFYPAVQSLGLPPLVAPLGRAVMVRQAVRHAANW